MSIATYLRIGVYWFFYSYLGKIQYACKSGVFRWCQWDYSCFLSSVTTFVTLQNAAVMGHSSLQLPTPWVSVSCSPVSLKQLPVRAEKCSMGQEGTKPFYAVFYMDLWVISFFTRFCKWVVIINTQFCSMFDILSALIFYARPVGRKHSLKNIRFPTYYRADIFYYISFFYYFFNASVKLSANSSPCDLCITSKHAAVLPHFAFNKHKVF